MSAPKNTGLTRAYAVASPQAGPLLHAPARWRFGPQPLVGWRDFGLEHIY